MAGVPDAGAVPIRRCAGCRQRAGIAELVRLVIDPTGELVLDPARRLPGRGCNVHPRVSCLDRALSPRALTRALRVTAPPPSAAARGAALA